MMNAEIGQKFEPAVGALLRASRLRCGEELRDVATILRIRYAYLEAIEEGRYEDLPGVTYAVGFVRTYADHLGLDTEEVVRRFKAESESLERRTELVFPSPIGERGTPGAAIIFIGVLVAALAYGAWYVGTSEDSVLDELVTPLPDRLAALLPGDRDQADEPASGPGPAVAAPQTDTGDAPTGSPGSPPPQPVVEEPAPSAEGVAADALEPEQPIATAPAIPVTETALPEAAVPGDAEPVMPAPDTPLDAAADAVQQSASVDQPEPPVVVSEIGEAPEPPLAPPPAEATPEEPAAEPEPMVAEAPSTEPESIPETPVVVPQLETPGVTPEPEIPPQADVAAQPVPQTPPVAEPQATQLAQAASEAPAEITPAPEVAENPDVPEAPEAPLASEAPEAPPVWPEDAPAVPTADQAEAETEPEPEQEAAVPEAPAATAAAIQAGATEVGSAGGSARIEARIEVRALSDSWIQIRDGVARRLLVTRLLRAGDTYVVPDQPGLTLLTGNAGALEILVDGETVEPIGEEGAVRRNVVLDAEKLLDGTAVVD